MTSVRAREWWTPISQRRVSWDLLFINRLQLHGDSSIAPDRRRGSYRDTRRAGCRSTWMWVLFTLGRCRPGWPRARSGFLSSLDCGPRKWPHRCVIFPTGSRRLGVPRDPRRVVPWSGIGTLMVAYLCRRGSRIDAALRRVQPLLRRNNISIDRMGALPLPPSFLDWGGVIRSIDAFISSLRFAKSRGSGISLHRGFSAG